MTRPAAFLDRDGTIIEDIGYVADPDLVRLLPGAAPGIRRLREVGFAVIVVTNQSGIARGLLTVDDYERVHDRMIDLLARDGAHIDGSYYCPHHPDAGSPCDCRKPGTLLFRQAAADHDIDLRRSLYVGDRWRDVEPALTLGGRGVLVDGPSTPPEDRLRAREEGIEIVGSLADLAPS